MFYDFQFSVGNTVSRQLLDNPFYNSNIYFNEIFALLHGLSTTFHQAFVDFFSRGLDAEYRNKGVIIQVRETAKEYRLGGNVYRCKQKVFILLAKERSCVLTITANDH